MAFGWQIDQFWSMVWKAPGCWLWQGSVNRDGYGRSKVGGRYTHAHRVAWQLTRGPIPDGLYVCHHCDNPPCCNPAHLFVGTAADNRADCVAKQRHSPGERNGRSKLTEADVRQIRAMFAEGLSGPAIAKRFGVPTGRVQKIVARESWKHVP